jgi:hypothetical protein
VSVNPKEDISLVPKMKNPPIGFFEDNCECERSVPKSKKMKAEHGQKIPGAKANLLKKAQAKHGRKGGGSRR